MEKYLIYNNNLNQHLFNVALVSAILYTENKPELLAKDRKITREELLFFTNAGLRILRSKNRPLYDSFFTAIFCIGIKSDYPEFDTLIAGPEDRSYDSTIILTKKGSNPKILNTIPVHFEPTVIKLELTELTNLSKENIKKLADKKLGPKHDYKNRVLLIINNAEGEIPLGFIKEQLKEKNVNFKTVRLLTKKQKNSNKYIIVDFSNETILLKEFEIEFDIQKLFEYIRFFDNNVKN